MSQQGLNAEDDLIEVGHVLGVHGVAGQVKVYSNTSPRQNVVTYSPWIIDQAGTQKTYEVNGKVHGKNVIASLKGVSGRDQAMDLIGAKILIKRNQLPTLSQGDYYWTQLEGMEVISTEGDEFGTIDHMLETGANDVMVVQGDRERLIPYVMEEVIISVNLEKNQIIVNWDADF